MSRDHLDYHKTFKDYFNSKLILFKRLMKKKSRIIFDEDLKISKKIKRISKIKKLKTLSLGSNNADLKIIEHKFINSNQEVKFLYKNKIYIFKTKLIGKVQIKNLIMSILAASKSNINFNNILKSVKKIKPVPGRLEKISNLNNNSIVILDYAHTPDALKVCLSNLKDQFSLKKINLVFGCGGERDIPKRAIMGKIANIYCKKVYLTDDNPRRENPKIIRNQIKIKINKKKLIEIPSRKLAINTAIKNAKSDEIVVVAGKGHETYQEYKKKKYFSDRDCILQSIKEKNKKSNKNWKTNVVEEKLKTKLKNKTIINKACINSKEIKKNNIFLE